MKNEVIEFKFNGNNVRTIIDDAGETWFVAKDVCMILGLQNNRDALARVPDAHKGIGKVYTPGGDQHMLTLDAPGLYRLILRSNKPEAEPLMEWVTSEVLPAIRKTGSYSISDPLFYTSNEMEDQISAMQSELLKSRPVWAKIKRYKDMGLHHGEIALLCRRDKSTIRVTVRRMEACGLIAPPRDLARLQACARHLTMSGGEA